MGNDVKLQGAPPSGESSRTNYFRTDHLANDLKRRSLRGGAVTMTSQIIKFFLQMSSTMLLARLLTPADFGVVAMVTAFTGFAALLKDAGLSIATVQREHVTHEQISTLFWSNVALSIFAMICVASLSPFIAWIYDEPRLSRITVVIACTFVLGGFTVQHQALLHRQMRFKELAIIEVVSLIIGIATAIVMAFLNLGCWSLVGLTVGSTAANCLLAWVACDWRPGFPSRRSGAGSMLKLGGGITAFNILNYLTRNSDNVIVGYALGSTSLGIYSKAYSLLMMPMQQINGPVGNVMIPALSRLQDEPERYQRAFLRAIGVLAFLGIPTVSLLYVLADEIVIILLGRGWDGTATVFRLLTPAALLGTINVAPGWLCVSLGRAKVQVIWAAVSSPIMVAAFLTGTNWGVTGVAAAFSISWSALFMLFLAMASHHSPVSLIQILTCLVVPLCASLAAIIICIFVIPKVFGSDLTITGHIVANVTLFLLMYALISIATPSGRRQILVFWHDIITPYFRRNGQESL